MTLPSRTETDIKSLSRELTDWASQSALPMWHKIGIDTEKGECFESIDPVTIKATLSDRRARVVPRQIYSLLEGAKLGWTGPATETAKRLWNWFDSAYKSPEGFYVNAVGIEGGVTDDGFDLYNQAFALFAMANIAQAIPDEAENAQTKALDLIDHLRNNFRHPDAGFLENRIDEGPLRSNPHMHLFEACLAWEEVSKDPIWSDMADEIAELALNHFIDALTGALREYFSLDWSPMPGSLGRIVEPGHQFEWAWLLVRWGTAREDADALIAARRLYAIGWTYGIDENRGAAFMALNEDFTVNDPVARLWAQTEWLKAATALASISIGVERDAYLADIPAAALSLQAFFNEVPEGLYKDKWMVNRTFKQEVAPASSLYHIVCAISELNAFSKTL